MMRVMTGEQPFPLVVRYLLTTLSNPEGRAISLCLEAACKLNGKAHYA
jgi:hypothetical protein